MPMISVIIPTLDAEQQLGKCLQALIPATLEGLIRELIIVDGGSTDMTLEIADEVGASIISTKRGRGVQLAAGGLEAKGPWLLFLHADTVLDLQWCLEARRFMERVEGGDDEAAAFSFALDDRGFKPRATEFMVGLRSRFLKLPYGDQGLLISKDFYQQLGGFAELPLMEDVDIIRRIGRARLRILPIKAVTSARRFLEKGYARRIGVNLYCLSLYFRGVSPHKIAQIYGRGHDDRS